MSRAKYGERLKLFLAAWAPTKTDNDIALQIGACSAYVRKTAMRKGLLLANNKPGGGKVVRLLTALHDAINRPMGVVPDSAVEFYDAWRVKS